MDKNPGPEKKKKKKLQMLNGKWKENATNTAWEWILFETEHT